MLEGGAPGRPEISKISNRSRNQEGEYVRKLKVDVKLYICKRLQFPQIYIIYRLDAVYCHALQASFTFPWHFCGIFEYLSQPGGA